MKRDITLTLVKGVKKHYRAEGSDPNWKVSRYTGGFFTSYESIGSVSSFALALELVKSDSGGSVADVLIKDA